MSDKPLFPDAAEPERYELSAGPSWLFESDRRSFFKFFGAGLFIICAASKAVALQESGASRRNFEDSLPKEIDAWLHIGEKGEITVFTGKVEVGQNIRTSLSQGVAEELRVPLDSVRLVMGDTQLVPFDMGTFGSRTTPTMNMQLRIGRRSRCPDRHRHKTMEHGSFASLRHRWQNSGSRLAALRHLF
jgi:hypothetical protein